MGTALTGRRVMLAFVALLKTNSSVSLVLSRVSLKMSTDIVYAIHDFEAENPDELSFKAGERIIVIERDDLYQDGWWQVGRA